MWIYIPPILHVCFLVQLINLDLSFSFQLSKYLGVEV